MEDFEYEEDLISHYLINLHEANRFEMLIKEVHNIEKNRDCCHVPLRSFMDVKVPEPAFVSPDLAGGRHNKLPNISKKLELTNVGDSGASKKLVAKKKFNVGDVLLVEKAAVFAFHPDIDYILTSTYRCHYCSRILDFFVTCPGCDVVGFCSYKCRYYSWNEYHRWECYAMQRGFFNQNTPSYVSMRMLFFRLQFEENALSQNYYNNEYNFAHFLNLPYNIKERSNGEILPVLKQCVDVILYLVEHTQFFEWIVQFPKYANKSQFQLYSSVGGMLLRYYFQFLENSIKLQQDCYHGILKSTRARLIGNGLFLSTQWFTESSHPNTLWFIVENYIIIKACKDIFPGDKITVRWREDEHNCSCKKCTTKAKFDAFRCKSCNSIVLPTDKTNNIYLTIKYTKSIDDYKDNVNFACEKCKKQSQLNDYKKVFACADEYINNYHIYHRVDYLNQALNECKKILNPHHIYLVPLYALYMTSYLVDTRDVLKYIEKATEALRIMELHYGKTSKFYVNAQIYVLYNVTEFCKRRNKFNNNVIQFCQSLLTALQLGARLYCLVPLINPIQSLVSLELSILAKKRSLI